MAILTWKKRDLQGGGWSGAYASTVMSNYLKMRLEIIWGKYLIYSPDDEQSFPSDFGADGSCSRQTIPSSISHRGIWSLTLTPARSPLIVLKMW